MASGAPAAPPPPVLPTEIVPPAAIYQRVSAWNPPDSRGSEPGRTAQLHLCWCSHTGMIWPDDLDHIPTNLPSINPVTTARLPSSVRRLCRWRADGWRPERQFRPLSRHASRVGHFILPIRQLAICLNAGVARGLLPTGKLALLGR